MDTRPVYLAGNAPAGALRPCCTSRICTRKAAWSHLEIRTTSTRLPADCCPRNPYHPRPTSRCPHVEDVVDATAADLNRSPASRRRERTASRRLERAPDLRRVSPVPGPPWPRTLPRPCLQDDVSSDVRVCASVVDWSRRPSQPGYLRALLLPSAPACSPRAATAPQPLAAAHHVVCRDGDASDATCAASPPRLPSLRLPVQVLRPAPGQADCP